MPRTNYYITDNLLATMMTGGCVRLKLEEKINNRIQKGDNKLTRGKVARHGEGEVEMAIQFQVSEFNVFMLESRAASCFMEYLRGDKVQHLTRLLVCSIM